MESQKKIYQSDEVMTRKKSIALHLFCGLALAISIFMTIYTLINVW